MSKRRFSFLSRNHSGARSLLRSCVLLSAAALSASCLPDLEIAVTSTADGSAGSLRAAIQQVNAGPRTTRIKLPPGTYALTQCGADDDNTAGDLDVTAAVAVFIEATGPGVVIRQDCAGERLFDGRGNGLLSFKGVTLTGGNVVGSGGAIQGRDVHLAGVTVTGNRATITGGGIAATTLIADDSSITDNALPTATLELSTTGRGGGGIYVSERALIRRSSIAGNEAYLGGGIVAGSLEMTDTRVTGNRAARFYPLSGTDWPAYTIGGGLIADVLEAERVTIADNALQSCASFVTGRYSPNGGSAFTVRTGTLVNATITGNVTPGCVVPYPLPVMEAKESLTLVHATVADNKVGAGVVPWISPVTNFQSSVILNDALAGCSRTDMIDDQYNWISEANCGLTGEIPQKTSEFLQLGPLADNGGAVPTRAPAATSALVNAIPRSACASSEDARGVARPQGAACDIGAVEVR
ncbi:MAG TPA: choice-of-anchor Q domain-containing protein [Polyangiaceae bacterium]|nr:choice-of-anchor Q domain-containing protein [Polyangiaceae bacterium]